MLVYSVIPLLLVAYAVGTPTSVGLNYPGYRCVPRSHFKKECNDCICNDEGTNAACTLKGCPKPKDTAVPENTPGFRCTPGEHFKSHDGCNDCVCGNDGKTAGCTFKLCPPTPHSVQKRSVAVPENTPGFTCTPGNHFKSYDGCNDCVCGPDGKTAGCTYKLCPHIPHPHQKRSVAPGHPDFQCEPGSKFKHADGCNSCVCAKNGKNAICTLMACSHIHKRDTPEHEDANCIPGHTKKIDCNTCTCMKGVGYVCTRLTCPKLSQESDPNFHCEPNTVFPLEDGCNTCTCDSEGKSAVCTLEDCSHKHKRAAEHEDANCVPGSTKKIDCNTCRCSPGLGYVCTKRTCPKLSQATDPNFHCEPNTVFPLKDSCNTCTCDSEGKSAVCTLEHCSDKHKRAAPEHEDPNCVPGSTKTIDCNTCRCAPGLGYVCTKMTCPRF